MKKIIALALIASAVSSVSAISALACDAQAQIEATVKNVNVSFPEAGNLGGTTYQLEITSFKADDACPLSIEDAIAAQIPLSDGQYLVHEGESVKGTLVYNAKFRQYSIR